MDKEEIELDELTVIIHNKIREYINKYERRPKYLKAPLWIYHCMQQVRDTSWFIGNTEEEIITYRGLIVCETITIQKAEEIEVF